MSSTSVSSTPLEFVVFYERNHKENEIFVFYLQWTGNEAELTRLAACLSEADFSELHGDFVEVALDLRVKLPESVVDTHCQLKHTLNSFHPMFTKCVGVFRCPLDETDVAAEADACDVAKLIDENFFTCRIKRMFTPISPASPTARSE